MARIENIDENNIKETTDRNLYQLRSVCMQLWESKFQGNSIQKSGSLSRSSLIEKYELIKSEILNRGLSIKNRNVLDKHLIDLKLFNISVPELNEIPIAKNFILITDPYVKNPKTSKRVDITIRANESERDPNIEKAIKEVISKRIKKEVDITWDEKGTPGGYISLFDLVLKPKEKTVKRKGASEKICKYCDNTASSAVEWGAETGAYVPTCDDHVTRAKVEIKNQGDTIEKVSEIKEIIKAEKISMELRSNIFEYYDRLDSTAEIQIISNGAIVEELESGSVLFVSMGSCLLVSALNNSGRKVFVIEENPFAVDLAMMKGIETMTHSYSEILPLDNRTYENIISMYAIEYMEKETAENIINEIQRITNNKAMILYSLDVEPIPGKKLRIIQEKKFKDLFPKGWKFQDIGESTILAVYQKPKIRKGSGKGDPDPEIKKENAADPKCFYCDDDIKSIYKSSKRIIPVCKKHTLKARYDFKSQGVKSIKVSEFQKAKSDRISKPFPNEHACRKQDPKKYYRFTRGTRKTEGGKTYSIIFGWLRKAEGDIREEQSFRYPKKTWTEKEAQSHCKEHKGIKFEPASKDAAVKKSGEKFVPIFKKHKKEQIVAGVVYEPREEDSQGEFSTAPEIRKACYDFMENTQVFKIMHEGRRLSKKDVKILENYIAPQSLTLSGQKIKKGTWLMTVRVLNKSLWKKIDNGEINGFSMAGLAKKTKTSSVKKEK
jgi:hypothetical protein